MGQCTTSVLLFSELKNTQIYQRALFIVSLVFKIDIKKLAPTTVTHTPHSTGSQKGFSLGLFTICGAYWEQ